MGSERTLGQHIASRLVEVGVRDCFSVPGDYNLVLLDQLLKEPQLRLIGCCNELNAGYAADGYARKRGVGCCIVTFTVGSLSCINAIAGAYSENLPLICIVTVDQVVINSVEDAYELIDRAFSSALFYSRPVYISVSCNIAGLTHPHFAKLPVPYAITHKQSNSESVRAAIEAAVEFLNSAVKPVIIVGHLTKTAKAMDEVVKLADASNYAVAVMPDGKGLFPEGHPHYIGNYWGPVSSPCCAEIVESSDACVVVGGVFNDYTSVGYSLLLRKEKMIQVKKDRVIIAGKQSFGCVLMTDFLLALAERVKKNATSYINYARMYVPMAEPPVQAKGEPLRCVTLFKHIQVRYEFQMQYGSIGWSVGATLGYAAANDKRVIACIGDGSFQVTAQDVGTMIRYGLNPIIFLINNDGYTIEVQIHDGPYNNIKRWDYCGVVKAIHNNEGRCWVTRVTTEEELQEAIATAVGEEKESLCFIEVILDRDDCSKELLEWGSRVAAANSRPPNPQ
eukprot:jgi/Chlat1/7607/Chrsp64S07108